VKRGEPHWRVEANEHPIGLKLTRWFEQAAPGPRSGWRFPQRLTRLSSPEKGRADRDRFSLRQHRTKESPASEMPPRAPARSCSDQGKGDAALEAAVATLLNPGRCPRSRTSSAAVVGPPGCDSLSCCVRIESEPRNGPASSGSCRRVRRYSHPAVSTRPRPPGAPANQRRRSSASSRASR
jgi:hypothetical protein